jgi:hypothetical protein
MEAGELAVYMFSTCLFATLLQHPASPVRHVVQPDFLLRALMGFAIGTTVLAMILSPWGSSPGPFQSRVDPCVLSTRDDEAIRRSNMRRRKD